tara:strand:- start:1153 stop:1731 length:579 start_codon:yes stop_codon:yes gene_type:complete
MTLPNKITFGRLLLAFIVVALLLLPGFPNQFTWAAIIFVLAASTDFIDGMIARRTKTTSGLGAFMDPLADKFLILLTFVVLATMNLYPLWLFVLMLARDLLNDAYRNYAASQRIIIGANPASKLKTTLQMLSLMSALLVLVFRHEQIQALSTASADLLLQIANILMLAALLVGVVGTAQFIAKHSRIISGNE